ncbi:hypothetical protein [Deinococcus alpinitundrae]|uniref:hypothetical protein n=1 Tax=Deinococcus alpinitundrae TaxID=468913 RepID=UPI00137B4150|nr:hypothetical protein [Deinococcus alpinitundrae]
MRTLLLTALLLSVPFSAAAQGRPPHKPPPPPQAELEGFAEAAGYLTRARATVVTLTPGMPQVQKTPGGPRLAVPLLYMDKVVARAFVSETGQLVPRGQESMLATGKLLQAGAQDQLRAQVASLTVSSLARVMGPQIYCYLLIDAQVVTELHFDRKTGQLLEDRGPPKRGDKKGPGPGKP